MFMNWSELSLVSFPSVIRVVTQRVSPLSGEEASRDYVQPYLSGCHPHSFPVEKGNKNKYIYSEDILELTKNWSSKSKRNQKRYCDQKFVLHQHSLLQVNFYVFSLSFHSTDKITLTLKDCVFTSFLHTTKFVNNYGLRIAFSTLLDCEQSLPPRKSVGRKAKQERAASYITLARSCCVFPMKFRAKRLLEPYNPPPGV